MSEIRILKGDCLDHFEKLENESIDLIYLDPPFFTQKVQNLSNRKGTAKYSFSDVWASKSVYTEYIFERVSKFRPKLKSSGSIFFHCDRSASHLVRVMLDHIFGENNFQSEIIWYFKRWSNARRGLLPNHQNIFWYSKSDGFKFSRIFEDYAPSTNVDQILQKRERDDRGKVVYKRDESGAVVTSGAKRGVPLSDVWELPYLNPKARERVGYPTQKSLLLLERIIELATENGDLVVDPFCGSGTTLVAALLLNRNAIGFDISDEAIEISNQRIANPIRTSSRLLDLGRSAYQTHNEFASKILAGLDYAPVQRSKGIDGILKSDVDGLPVLVRVQREHEALIDSVAALRNSARKKGKCRLIVVQTVTNLFSHENLIEGVKIVSSPALEISSLISKKPTAWIDMN